MPVAVAAQDETNGENREDDHRHHEDPEHRHESEGEDGAGHVARLAMSQCIVNVDP